MQELSEELRLSNDFDVIKTLATVQSDLGTKISHCQFTINRLRSIGDTADKRRTDALEILQKVQESIQTSERFFVNRFRLDGFKPNLFLTHTASTLKFDVFANLFAEDARSTRMEQHCSHFPALFPICTLIGTALRIRKFSNLSDGGPGRNGIYAMALVSLKYAESLPASSSSSSSLVDSRSSGQQLLNFLDFWGHVDIEKIDLRFDPPNLKQLEPDAAYGKMSRLAIWDTFGNLNLKVAGDTRKWEIIQAFFREAYTKMTVSSTGNMDTDKSLSSMLGVMLAANYRTIQDLTDRLDKYLISS